MNAKAICFFLMISTLSLMGKAQDHAWRLRLGGDVAYGAGINPLNPNTVFAPIFGGGHDTLEVSYNKGVTWTTQATGLYFGRILVHPADTLVMFALATGGLIRSSDYGLSWTTVFTAPTNVVSVVIDPIYPDTMYAATLSGSVYRSTNRGITWEIISYVGDDLCTLAIRPDSTNILYAGWAGKISKSTDGGFSWRLIVTTGADDIPFVFVDFHNPLIAYATAHKGYYGVWKTIDGGANWNPTTPPNFSYWAMDVDRSNPAIVYVGESPGTVISRSTDEGVSWDTLGRVGVGYITVHPVDGDLWVGSFDGLYRWTPLRSTVEGMVLDNATGEPIVNGFVELTSTGERVTLDTTGGSYTLHYYEDDPAMTTIHVEAYPYYIHDEPIEIIADSSISRNIYLAKLPQTSLAGTVEDSMSHSPLSGVVTLISTTPLGIMNDTTSTDLSGNFLIDSLYVSEPPVVTYSLYLHPELPHQDMTINPVVLDTSQNFINVLLDTADVLLTSSPGSGDFSSFYTSVYDSLGITFNFWDPVTQGVLSLRRAVEMRKDMAVFYTGDDADALPQSVIDSLEEAVESGVNLFITGQNFVEANALSEFVSTRLGLAHEGNSFTIDCLGLAGDLFSNLHIYTSGPDGANNQTSRDKIGIVGSVPLPTIIYGSLANLGTAAVRLDNTGSGGKAVVFGFGFESISTRTQREAVMQNIVGYFDGSIVLDVREGGSQGWPVSYQLRQNYPNPFNPITTITFSLPHSGDVSLKIFNLLGEEVATLVSGQLEAASHTVQWDATGQPSGVYFYRLQGGDFIQTKKLVLMK